MTLVFVEPVTVAENCCIPAVCSDAEVGLIDTVTPEFVGGGFCFEPDEPEYPAHPPKLTARATIRRPAQAPNLCRSATRFANRVVVSENGMVVLLPESVDSSRARYYWPKGRIQHSPNPCPKNMQK